MIDIAANNKYSELLKNIADEICAAQFSPFGRKFEVRMIPSNSVHAEATMTGPDAYAAEISYGVIQQAVADSKSFYDQIISIRSSMPASSPKYILDAQAGAARYSMNKDEFVNNCTSGAIIWLLLHELAHITQGHIFIGTDGNRTAPSSINESPKSAPGLTGKDAELSHTKELAADHQASFMSAGEMIRHHQENSAAYEFNLNEMMAGITMMFYRFYGCESDIRIALATGTHPHPILRLEMIIAWIMENMDFLTKLKGAKFSKAELRLRIVSACWDATYYSFQAMNPGKSISLEHLPLPVLERAGSPGYFSRIVSTWDEVRPTIIDIGTYIDEKLLMSFNDEFRERIGGGG